MKFQKLRITLQLQIGEEYTNLNFSLEKSKTDAEVKEDINHYVTRLNQDRVRDGLQGEWVLVAITPR